MTGEELKIQKAERDLLLFVAKAQLTILDVQMKLLFQLHPVEASTMARAIGRAQGDLEYSIEMAKP